jgi:hypothetical protein
MINNMAATDQKHINPMSNEPGDSVSVIYMPQIMSNGPQNPLVAHVNKLLNGEVSTFRYVRSDIVVLVCDDDTHSAGEAVRCLIEVFNRHMPDVSVRTAENRDSHSIIIDTVDNFSGLDAKAVICVVPNERAMTQIQTCTSYRVSIASKALLRLDILIPSPLTIEVARSLKMDRIRILKGSPERYLIKHRF